MSNTVITVTNDPSIVITGDTPTVAAIAPVTVQPTYDYNNLTNLPPLGTAAELDVGTTANHVVELDANAKLPAVDASQLTMLPARNLNCGRLVYVSLTQIKFIPFKGALIQINGQLYVIPSAGISVSNVGLAVSTLYYAYVSISGGSMVMTLSTVGHATSSTVGNYGIEIKTGDDNYSLVGMIWTSGGTPGFYDTPVLRWVASWFNQRPRNLLKITGGAYSTTANTYTEMGGGNERIYFVCWAGNNTTFHFTQSIDLADNGVAGQISNLAIGLDSGTQGSNIIGYNGSVGINYMPFSGHYEADLAEGYHWFSIWWASGLAGYTTSNIGSGYGLLTGSVFI